MKQTDAPQSTTHSPTQEEKSPSQIFISMALDMTWRIGVAILVPIIGGYELDQSLKTGSTFLIVGFVVALLAVLLVMRYTVQAANQTNKKEKQA